MREWRTAHRIKFDMTGGVMHAVKRGLHASDASRNAADTAPPEDTPARTPSTRASARMVSSASLCEISITLSTADASKIEGTYSFGHLLTVTKFVFRTLSGTCRAESLGR